jgi:hypothetical protein
MQDCSEILSGKASDREAMSMGSIMHHFTFAQLPKGSILSSVKAQPDIASGRHALKVQLMDDITVNGKPNIDYVDMPTFVVLPITMTNGNLSVDILSSTRRHRATSGPFNISPILTGASNACAKPIPMTAMKLLQISVLMNGSILHMNSA